VDVPYFTATAIGGIADVPAAPKADHRAMRIEAIMTKQVLSVSPETPLKDVARLLTGHNISGVPVCGDDDEVLGVVSEADILRKEEGVPPDTGGRLAWLFRRLDDELNKVSARTAGEAMTAPAVTIRPKQQVSDAAKLMIERRINRLPVVVDGKLVGIVTRADLVRAFHRPDAEIEREIREEILHWMIWIAPSSLELTVRDGKVTIRGTVDTRLDAESIASLLRRVPGVTDVDYELDWRYEEPVRFGGVDVFPR
jgi:CBS domain-containing protein